MKPINIKLAEKYDNTTVIPQQFGAVGDGKTDDIAAIRSAIEYAKANNLTLTLPEAEYYISDTLDLGDITVISENAKISFYGMTPSVPAVNMLDNTKIYGKINIWSVDNTIGTGIVNHGGRCGLGFGVYRTGIGVKNCYVEHVEVTGGIPNSNGVFITGYSNDITIDRVTVPSGTNISRAVLVHWGNDNDKVHHCDENHMITKTEYPVYTTHPHNLHFGVIESKGLYSEIEKSTPICLSAGYDITADEVISDSSDFLVMVLPGDCAFDCADKDDREIGSRNLVVKKAVGKNIKSSGIYVCGCSPFRIEPEGYSMVDITVGVADVELAPSTKETYGVALHKTKKATIGTLNLKNCNASLVHLSSGAHNVTIGTLNAENCSGQVFESLSKEHQRDAENVNIGTINLKNHISPDKTAFKFSRIENVNVKNVNIENGSFNSIMNIEPTAKNIHISELDCK